MKKGLKLAVGLFLAMTVSLFSSINSFVMAAEFPDVPTDHKNYEAITYLAEMGVIAGYDDGTFDPGREITRTEFCALMARTLGYDKDSYIIKPMEFSDVAPGYWGEAYISFCYELGLINGMGDGTFAPASKVTLEQAVKMAVCAIDKQSQAASIKGETWYFGYVTVATQQGLLASVERSFGENASRGNIAQVVYNMVKKGVGVKLPEEELSPDDGTADEGLENEDVDRPDDETEEILDPIVKAFREKDFSEVKTILIDAGHNYSGSDTGAENKELELKEEVITWQIADKLRDELELLGYTVVMTRENLTDSIANTSVVDSLQARVDMSHSVLADLYISIHCNAGGGNGVETYCFQKTGYSGRAAELIQRSIVKNTQLYDRGVKTANFFVIKNTLMPTILIETGFIDSEKDAEILASDIGQAQIAGAIAEAVSEYDSMDPIVEARFLNAEDKEETEDVKET